MDSTKLLSIRDVAQLAGIQEDSVRVLASPSRRKTAANPMPEPAVAKPIRWEESDIRAWMERRVRKDRAKILGIGNCHCGCSTRIYLDSDDNHTDLHVEDSGGLHTVIPIRPDRVEHIDLYILDALIHDLYDKSGGAIYQQVKNK